MISYLKSLMGELTPEQELLRNRLAMGGALAFAGIFFAFDAIIFCAVFAYIAFNAALYAMQRFKIARAEDRWLAAIIFDVALALAVMLREPEGMSFFHPIMLWLTLGNGFRFGVRWLFVAAILSTTAFGFIVLSTVYWQQNLTLGLGLAAALLVIPAYCSSIIRKISLAKEEAEAASKAKSYFLASVSHELRTPLNAIIGYGNHLRQSDMPRGQKEMVEASVLAGEHLLHLIEQLIEVARSGAGSARIKNSMFRNTELLAEIRNIMAVRVEDKGLNFHLQAEPLSDRTVDGPTDVLRNILLNLVGNAAKFTEAGSIAIQSGFSHRNGQDHIWFTVSDTGIGIADSAIERIFQPFQQADDTVMNRFGGTGLGLAICKQLIEQVNGQITANSVLGRGSEFHIEVPVIIREVLEDGQSSTSHVVNMISFGAAPPALCAGEPPLEHVNVTHVRCGNAAELASAIAESDLSAYEVALVSQDVALDIEADSAIWKKFAEAEIAPVLVSGDDGTELEDKAVCNAFASILPGTPKLPELLSAIRIASTFARHFRQAPDTELSAISVYTPRKILVADDNRTNRNVLGAILGSAGHDVTMVTDGDEALQALGRDKFDIVLLDVNMPRLNGIDACSMWRQIEDGGHRIPIIGVTADATAETEQLCINAGMDLRLTKPVDAKLMLSTIERLCDESIDSEVKAKAQTESRNIVVPITRATHVESEVIDPTQFEYLMSIGDDAFVLDMVDGFFQDADETMEPIRQSVHHRTIQDFRFYAHAIKSSSNNMGAIALADLCGHLEKITESDFDENRFVYLEKIEAEFARAMDALKLLTQDISAALPQTGVR
jgi:two-component system, sensor histidine kinase RpfC